MPGQFNARDYIGVQERINRFWQEHEEGAINTEIVGMPDFDHIVIQANVYRHKDDMRASASGIAAEERGATFKDGANFTSWHENCETSAIGRALANMGYASSSKDRPSREEVNKVERSADAPRSAQDRSHEANGQQHVQAPSRNAEGGTAPRSAPQNDSEPEIPAARQRDGLWIHWNRKLHGVWSHDDVHCVVTRILHVDSVTDASGEQLQSIYRDVEDQGKPAAGAFLARMGAEVGQVYDEPPADAEQVPIEPDVLAAANADIDAQAGRPRRHYDD